MIKPFVFYIAYFFPVQIATTNACQGLLFGNHCVNMKNINKIETKTSFFVFLVYIFLFFAFLFLLFFDIDLLEKRFFFVILFCGVCASAIGLLFKKKRSLKRIGLFFSPLFLKPSLPFLQKKDTGFYGLEREKER